MERSRMEYINTWEDCACKFKFRLSNRKKSILGESDPWNWGKRHLKESAMNLQYKESDIPEYLGPEALLTQVDHNSVYWGNWIINILYTKQDWELQTKDWRVGLCRCPEQIGSGSQTPRGLLVLAGVEHSKWQTWNKQWIAISIFNVYMQQGAL